MLLIFLSWLLSTFVFLTFGQMLISVWNRFFKKDTLFSFFDMFWLGLCVVSILLMLISFVSPINIYITILLFLVSIVYWFINYRNGLSLLNKLKYSLFKLSISQKVVLFLLFFLILICNLKNLVIYDTNLYYMQSLMWNEQYSIVPGLGNLHSRFGFNSNFLLLSTLYYYPNSSLSFFPLNSLCTFIVLSWFVIELFKAEKILHQVVLFLASFAILQAYFEVLSSLSTDVLPNLIILYILFYCVVNKKDIGDKVLVLCTLSVFSITLKLSLAPICVISLYILYLLLKEKKYTQFLFITSIISFIVIPWCARTAILTGYILYPFSSIDLFSFDWEVPLDLVDLEKKMVYAWAKAPGVPVQEALDLPLEDTWLIRYLMSNHFSRIQLLYILIVCSPILMLINLKKWKSNRFVPIAWFVALIGVALNFLAGPDPRFSQGFIISAALIPFMFFSPKKWSSPKVKFIWYGVFLVFFFLNFKRVKEFVIEGKSEYTPLYTLIYKPEPLILGNEKGDVYFYEYSIDGFNIYATNPIGVDPEFCYESCNDLSYNHELPCTPYLNKNLELRGNLLQNGFRIINK